MIYEINEFKILKLVTLLFGFNLAHVSMIWNLDMCLKSELEF